MTDHRARAERVMGELCGFYEVERKYYPAGVDIIERACREVERETWEKAASIVLQLETRNKPWLTLDQFAGACIDALKQQAVQGKG